MAKKLNRGALEAALKRAAKVATTGPRSARSGRFLSSGPPKRLSNTLVVETVSSTAIKDIDYDPKSRELSVTFVSDRTYLYEGVPPGLFADFQAAESKGRFFNTHVRDAFEFRQVR